MQTKSLNKGVPSIWLINYFWKRNASLDIQLQPVFMNTYGNQYFF